MTKVTELTETTTPTGDDSFHLVNDPGGTPDSQRVSLQSVANWNAVEDVTGTTSTAALADRGKTKRLTNATSCTVTIPTNAAVAFPIGSTIMYRATGGGTISSYIIQGDTGVTLDTVSAGSAAFSEAIKAVVITKVDTDTWYIDGAIGAVS